MRCGVTLFFLALFFAVCSIWPILWTWAGPLIQLEEWQHLVGCFITVAYHFIGRKKVVQSAPSSLRTGQKRVPAPYSTSIGIGETLTAWLGRPKFVRVDPKPLKTRFDRSTTATTQQLRRRSRALHFLLFFAHPLWHKYWVPCRARGTVEKRRRDWTSQGSMFPVCNKIMQRDLS